MTTQNIPWHNPNNVDPSALKPGERFLLVEEVGNTRKPVTAWLTGNEIWSDFWGYAGDDSDITYKTREPLPAKYQQVFTPIPPGLTPLPNFDSTTHWWKYRQHPIAGPIKCAVIYHKIPNEWHVYIDGGASYFEELDHVIELVEIRYDDPEYRAYVEDQHRKGAKIEMNANENDQSMREGWIPNRVDPLDWELLNYRIAQPAPEATSPEPEKAAEVEPDYNSRDHKLSVLAAALDGEMCQYLPCNSKEWRDEDRDTGQDMLFMVVESIAGGNFVRIKPKAPPAPVPLDDFKLSEALKDSGNTIWMIVGLRAIGTVHLNAHLVLGEPLTRKVTPYELMERGYQIHRNGSWQLCHKLAQKA